MPDQKEQSDASITLAEYEAYEALDEAHAEVHEGKLFRLSGTTRTHSIVLGELFSTIHAQIQTLDRPCEVHTSTYDALLSSDPLIVFRI